MVSLNGADKDHSIDSITYARQANVLRYIIPWAGTSMGLSALQAFTSAPDSTRKTGKCSSCSRTHLVCQIQAVPLSNDSGERFLDWKHAVFLKIVRLAAMSSPVVTAVSTSSVVELCGTHMFCSMNSSARAIHQGSLTLHRVASPAASLAKWSTSRTTSLPSSDDLNHKQCGQWLLLTLQSALHIGSRLLNS